MLPRKYVKLIHVARKAVNMSEEDYRVMLESFGVEHTSDLGYMEFQVIMREFKKMGFKYRRKYGTERNN